MDVPRKDTAELDAFLAENMTKTTGTGAAQGKLVINNVCNFFKQLKEYPDLLKQVDFKKPRELTARICGVSVRNLDIIKQHCRNGSHSQLVPKKRRPRYRPVTDIINSDKANIIKGIVEEMRLNDEYPSAKKIVQIAKQKICRLKCSETSMRGVLKMLGYNYIVEPASQKIRLNINKPVLQRNDEGKLLKQEDPHLHEVYIERNDSDTVKTDTVMTDDVPHKTIETESVTLIKQEIIEENPLDDTKSEIY